MLIALFEKSTASTATFHNGLALSNDKNLPVPWHGIVLVIHLVFALAAAGCRRTESPRFGINLEGRDSGEVRVSQSEVVFATLERLFGTPDAPHVSREVDVDHHPLELAAGPIASNEQGMPQGLFRQHCVSCHGISGDGAGPAASLLNPYPRDFRRGIFKYTSTISGAKPTREDLRRTIRHGAPGTAMPSFACLPAEHLDALVEYVRYLSIRGETELAVILLVVDDEEPLPLDGKMVLEEALLPVADAWRRVAEYPKDYVVVPPPPPVTGASAQLAASIARGRALYADKNVQCVKCHGPEGRGDGVQNEFFDDWNQPKHGETPGETAMLAERYTLPIQRLRPRDFTQGCYRGGNRPIDLYRRIYVGIKGTPMPASGPAPGAAGTLTPDEIWDVVNYVRSLQRNP